MAGASGRRRAAALDRRQGRVQVLDAPAGEHPLGRDVAAVPHPQPLQQGRLARVVRRQAGVAALCHKHPVRRQEGADAEPGAGAEYRHRRLGFRHCRPAVAAEWLQVRTAEP